MEIVSLVIGVVGLVLAVYAVWSQRKPTQELHDLYKALLASPDLRVERDAHGAITNVRVLSGDIMLPGIQVAGTLEAEQPN